MGVVLNAQAVRRTYQADGVAADALRGVDLAIDEGEFVAIMGPSGCGKSTLLHLLGALDTPTSGQVLLDGTSLGDLAERQLTEARRNQVGIVFQFFNLVPVLTAEENVALPAVISSTAASERAKRVSDMLGLVGLATDAGKLPSQLSGGQQQRVAIARALVNGPRVLLADEPTGNLDHANGVQVMELFASLHHAGQTIVLVTHDASVASYADRVVFMRDGTVVDSMTVDAGRDPALILARLVALESPAPA